MSTISASQFKARCLAILDDVAHTKRHVIILKRGKPVAELCPVSPPGKLFAQYRLKGSVRFLGDVVKPALPAEHWDAEGRERR